MRPASRRARLLCPCRLQYGARASPRREPRGRIMGRLIGGIVLVIIGVVALFGTISNVGFDLIAVLVLLAVIIIGAAVAYWGWQYVAGRQRALPIIERMAKEGAVIDTPAAAEETGLSVEQVRKHVQYAKMKGYIERNVEVK